MSPRALFVTPHAIRQLERRCGTLNASAHVFIEREVREAFAARRVSNAKPPAFRLYGERRHRATRRGKRYAWSADGRRCYVVTREEDGRDAVVTTLTRSWAEEAAA